MKILNVILQSIILCMSIFFIALGLDKLIFALLGIFIAPLIIILVNKKLKVNIIRYYGTLTVIFIISFISCGVMILERTGDKESINTEINIQVDNGEEAEVKNPSEIINENKYVNKCGIKDNNSSEGLNTNSVVANAAIHFINTGNSDSILIVQGEKSVLIDGGDNDDETLICEYLKKQGINNITYMIATHPHSDHIGGLDAVLNNIEVENLFVANGSYNSKAYTDFINAAADKGVNPSVPLDGVKYTLSDNSYIKIFNTNGGSSTNEQSLVTLFVNGNDKSLFMGDAETETESEISGNLSEVDLLKVGHHGSKSSTSNEFLNKTVPRYAVITVGNNNKYKHPHKVTMSKLENNAIEVHRTDECGTIIFSSSGLGIFTDCIKGSYNSADY